jgi:hypothetical protein
LAMLEANNERAGFSSLKKIFSKNTFRRDTKSAKDDVSRSIIFWYKKFRVEYSTENILTSILQELCKNKFYSTSSHPLLIWKGFLICFIKKICCLKQEYWRKYGRTHCAESALNNVMDNASKKNTSKMQINDMEFDETLLLFNYFCKENNKAKTFLVS